MATFFLTGIMGNLTFVGADLTRFFFTGFPNSLSLSCGVGASGAVYGVMGAATGLRGVVLIIFIAGLDIFAGGGFLEFRVEEFLVTEFGEKSNAIPC